MALRQKKVHINVLELPIVLAVELWGPLLENHCIMFFSDNMATVCVIYKLTAKDDLMMSVMRRLALAAMTYIIMFKSEHILGKNNITAGYLSRFQVRQARQVAPWLAEVPLTIPEELLPWDTRWTYKA